MRYEIPKMEILLFDEVEADTTFLSGTKQGKTAVQTITDADNGNTSTVKINWDQIEN